MAKAQKSPQQKKDLEYSKGHFTFAEYPHAFRRNWKRKKARANRKYRRKADELLAQVKPEMPANDVGVIAGDITVAQLAKSVLRERLRKSGTVTVGEKVNLTLEKRAKTVGRRVRTHEKHDREAAEAVMTLNSLEGDQLIDFVRRSAIFCRGGDPIEWSRVQRSEEPIDRALFFLHEIQRGSTPPREALRKNEELCKRFQAWAENANRILTRDQRVQQRKINQKQSTEKNVKTLRRQAEST